MTENFKRLKVLFAGSGPFAEPIFLETLKIFPDTTLITKKDKPRGRGQKILASNIIKLASRHQLETLQVENGKELAEIVKTLCPALVITASFGIIIPSSVLSLPEYGFINFHPSLLPKYRGSGPIQTAILNGDKRTGISIIRLNEGIDQGNILFQESLTIQETETSEQLEKRILGLITENLEEFFSNLFNGCLNEKIQDNSQASFSKKITKKDGEIDWKADSLSVERKIRALNPWPGTFTHWEGKQLKIISGEAIAEKTTLKPGTFFVKDNAGYVSTGNGLLKINIVQLEGKKPLEMSQFLLGHAKIKDSIFS